MGIVCSIGLLFAAGNAAAVDLLAAVGHDLAPASGYVIMPVDGQYLIDLDASRGTRVGDLISVIRPGERVVHPVTGKILGSLDEVTAVLKVTRVKNGYSYAEVVDEREKISNGAVCKRFSALSAALVGGDREFYDALRKALPDLEWQGQFVAGEQPEVDLVFALTGETLNLMDARGGRVRGYDLKLFGAVPTRNVKTDATSPAAPAPVPVPRVTSVPVPAPAPVPVPVPVVKGSLQTAPAGRGVVDFGRFGNLGELAERVQMAAFHRAEKDLLMATVDGKSLRVYRVTDGPRLVGETRIGNGVVQPLTVAWWQPKADGRLYLVVSGAEEDDRNYGNEVYTRMAGAVIEWRDGKLVPVVNRLRWFLGSYDRDGDGRPETLLGQRFDLDITYGKVVALSLDGSSLKETPVPFELPQEFVVPGSLMADLTGDGKLEVVVVRHGYLSIFAGKKKLYQSSEQMGGSLDSLTYDTNPGSVDLLHRTVNFEVPPAVADIDGDGVLELVALAAEGNSVKVQGLFPSIEKSWVAVVKFRNGLFEKGRLPGDRENPLQGVWAERGRVLVVESRTSSQLKQAGSSYLLQFVFDQKQ
ncbi:hypothetical protein C2E25_00040 [Geothermobacter hydrogeniphilus]|uniref:Repeat domain-containing protein n=1 Tax=Geothermobacter hydrogeniphilus TaxID=1969733 RepID=A0A2K2HED3_9BACT|nr:hypothetical protein C2E25_00040 [Geothermobacter hydrogeniphilus]